MLSDEAVLALSSLLGDMVKDEVYAIQIVFVALIALVAGSRTAVYHSVLVAYAVRQFLLLPLDNFTVAALLIYVATRAQPHFKNINLVVVVAYTSADVLASNLLNRARPAGSMLVLLLSSALAVYVLNTQSWGVGGNAIFRIAKFILVQEGVRQLLAVGVNVVFHPFLWLGVGVVLVLLSHAYYPVSSEQLALTDAVLHAAAASVAATTIGLPTRVTTMELMVVIVMVYFVLETLPASPIRNLARSVVLFIAIINLRALGIFPVLILLLAESSGKP
jgi:hypothetical protein